MKQMMGMSLLPADQKISKQLNEKICLAVSGVNNCRYCSWLHTKTALEKGLAEEEVRALLATEFEDLDPEDATVVLYAQHWSDCDGQVTSGARNRMLDKYGSQRTAAIEAQICAVYFGNLCSNTVFAYRQGQVDTKWRPTTLLTYLLSLPVAIGIMGMAGLKEP
ncbi:MAG: carboxymuconolactone decarboxylase family protein [Candidatus Alcyoniella australis]|nr:carboxymuconolactone decarboxylase family protein [Candidatus Alcyoniella australis]